MRSCFSFLFAVQSADAVSCFLAFLGSLFADSPLLSTLVAQNAPAWKGTTLTIVNSIGLQLRYSYSIDYGLRAVTDTNTILLAI
jgi:hypothetical protein